MAERERLAEQPVLVVQVRAERLLVADGLGRLIWDDRAVVDAGGEIRKRLRTRVPQDPRQHAGGGAGELPHRPDAEAGEGLHGLLPDSPERPDRERIEEAPEIASPDV